MLFHSGDKESRISMKNVKIRENDRKHRNPEISPKTRENRKSRKTRKTGIGRKGGPQPGPARGPLLLMNRAHNSRYFCKKTLCFAAIRPKYAPFSNFFDLKRGAVQ